VARSGHGGINRCAVLVGPVVYGGAMHAVQGRVVSVLTVSIVAQWTLSGALMCSSDLCPFSNLLTLAPRNCESIHTSIMIPKDVTP
jgi:hypothetical protein